MSGGEISPEQSCAARRLLNWSPARLASRSTLSESAIRNFEKSLRAPPIDKLASIRAALEAAGVEFTNGGDQPGVRLKKADGVIRATWDPPPKTQRRSMRKAAAK